MPINFSDVKTILYNWVIANIPSGMPAIYYYPNAPRPTVDYVTMLISSINQIGWDWQKGPDDNLGISEQVGDREFTYQIQAYGGNVLTVLQNLRTSLQKDSVLSGLASNGIAFFNWSSIQDITDLIDSRFEQRATMDIFFRIADVYSDNSGVISTVELEETFLDAQENVVYNEIIIIPQE